jgi:hypothetical protein
MIDLYSQQQTKNALKQACFVSSIARTKTDISAGGGIVFETAFEESFNSQFSEEFPYRLLLKQSLDLIELVSPESTFDWGPLGSKDQLMKNIKTEWTEQSNADFIFFRVEGDNYTFVDAWSNKTSISVDLIDVLGRERTEDFKKKKTSKLDLVNVKTAMASQLIENYSSNLQTKLNMGRCLLTISNNGTYSSYFWDGRLSSILNSLNLDSASIAATAKEVQCKIASWPKKAKKGKKDPNPILIGCSNREIIEGQQSTSFGRSLWINVAPARARPANFMAEKMSDMKVFERVSSGSIDLKSAILGSLRTRLNLKTEKSHDNAA